MLGFSLPVPFPSHQDTRDLCRLPDRRTVSSPGVNGCLPVCNAAAQPFQLNTPSPSERSANAVQVKKTGVIIVPGKFDAFHLGHQELARVAASFGAPTLLSFSGMAEALKWAPRAPVVAPIERGRVLRSWSSSVGCNVHWRILPFLEIRDLMPGEFLDMLVNRFNAKGIVCGKDWRFGKRAVGNIDTLLDLGPEKGLHVQIVDDVDIGDGGGVVSSTRVRSALAKGEVAEAATLLGRRHRLVGYAGSVREHHVDCNRFINQVPGDGEYVAVVRVIGRSEPFRTKVQVRRPLSADPLVPVALLDDPDEVLVQIVDAEQIYCEDCEVYIDFEERTG